VQWGAEEAGIMFWCNFGATLVQLVSGRGRVEAQMIFWCNFGATGGLDGSASAECRLVHRRNLSSGLFLQHAISTSKRISPRGGELFSNRIMSWIVNAAYFAARPVRRTG